MLDRQRMTTGLVLVVLAVLEMQMSVRADTCPNLCNQQGHCDNPDNVCECYEGYQGADCSERVCPSGPAWADEATATDEAHNTAECSNRGLCDRTTGACTCETDRFEGQACERKTCPSDCSFVGVCMSMKNFAAAKDPGEGTVYSYDSVWDAEMMYGCVCDPGYFGADCSLRHCPTGDDPLTGTSSDSNGLDLNEKQVVTCKATSGTFTLAFAKQTTANIDYDASEDEVKAALEALTTIDAAYGDAVSVTYSASGSSACLAGGNIITVEFLQNFGDLPLIVADATNLAHVSASGVSLSVAETVAGSKEDDFCSNRGICDTETGTCTCSTNWDTSDGYGDEGQRGDCGYATASITACPGTIACSGHGVCEGTPTYACLCSDGFEGADCSEMTCPYYKSWFSLPSSGNTGHDELAECADMGTCDRSTGECSCMDGFEGSACERMSCPGDPACNSQGECLTMDLLAEAAELNGDATSYTYGATPNDPLTWDAERVQGCLCDEGYEGYDCSLFTCPYGDDPITLGVGDIQIISCRDTVESDEQIVFTFRQSSTTGTITPDTTVAELQTALEALDTITEIDIELVGDDLDDADALASTICTEVGAETRITFVAEPGDVPNLQVSAENVDSITVSEFSAGTTEYKECSGRGLCDRTSGDCVCFTGFGSSDGQGGSGDRADCGYKMPIIAGDD